MRRWREAARVASNLEWVFLALMLPAVILIRPPTAPLLLIIPLFWLVRRLATGHFIPTTPLDGPILLLLLMVLVSLWATFDLAVSLLHVAGLLYGVALFYAVFAAAGRSRRALWRAVILFLALQVLLTAASLFFTRWPARAWPRLPAAPRLPQAIPFLNPNAVAGTLLWGPPLLFALALGALVRIARWGRRGRGPSVLALATSAALFVTPVLCFTQSRSALLGLAAAVLFLALSPLRQHPLLLLFLLPTLLGLALIAAGLALIHVPPATWQDLGLSFSGTDVGTVGGLGLAARREIWQRALFGIQDFPFSGMGMDTFRYVAPVLYPTFLVSPTADVAHAHNTLLQTALDLGLPGLIAYLAIWIGAGATLWSAWRHTRDFWLHTLLLGLGACLLTFFVYGLTDAVPLGARHGFLFWIVLGLIAALARRVAPATRSLSIHPNR